MTDSYIKRIKTYMSPSRVSHSLRVSDAASMLAKHHHANINRVKKAAILHDIAKNQTPESLQALGIHNVHQECWDSYPSVWHAFVAPELIDYEWPGEAKDISDMVMFHTTGKDNMSIETKIVFIADFIEPNRSHEKREEIEAIAIQNLDSAVAWITHLSIEKLTRNNRQIHPLTLKCWDFYCNYISDGKKWHQDD